MQTQKTTQTYVFSNNGGGVREQSWFIPSEDTLKKTKSSQAKEFWNSAHPLPYSLVRSVVTPPGGTVSNRNLTGVGIETVGPFWPFSYAPAGGYPTMAGASDNQARAKFNENLIAARTQALVILRERAEAARSIRRIYGGISEALFGHYNSKRSIALRLELQREYTRTGGRWSLVPRLAKDVSDYWLEWNFGIKPLFNDLKSVYTVLASDKDKKRIKVTGSDQKDYVVQNLDRTSYSATAAFTYTSAHSLVLGTLSVSDRITYGCSVGVEPQMISKPKQLGISWESILPSAWEMIPYSFVVDYFTNTGDFITYLSSLSVSNQGFYRSHLRARTEKIDVKMRALPGYQISGDFSGGVRVLDTFDRLTSGITPMPTFEFKTPSLKQAANLVALLTNKLIRSKGLFSPIF